MRNGVFLFLLFGITLNCFADSYDVRIAELTQQKLAKMQELEECGKSVKGFKIAGISTIGLTAVGVGGNIALANKQAKLDEEIESVENSIAEKECEIESEKKKEKANNTYTDLGVSVDAEGSEQEFQEKSLEHGESNYKYFCEKAKYNFDSVPLRKAHENEWNVNKNWSSVFSTLLHGDFIRDYGGDYKLLAQVVAPDLYEKVEASEKILEQKLDENFFNSGVGGDMVNCKKGQTPKECVKGVSDLFYLFDKLGYIELTTVIDSNEYGYTYGKISYQLLLEWLYYQKMQKEKCNNTVN